jgi:predicted nucleotidyltransferase
MKTTILKVLVGSRAYGLADEYSDYDYRSVYVLPTSDILSLNYKYKGNDWIERNEDNTSYEIGHFLYLATKCNPSILEIFKAPIQFATEDGVKLVELFPYVWNPQGVFDAFVGYGLNQRKKMLDKKDNRQVKYAIAYLRTLYNLIELLTKKDFSLEIKESKIKETLMSIKQGLNSYGQIIDASEQLVYLAKMALSQCKHEPNLEKVNEFLIDIRRRYW